MDDRQRLLTSLAAMGVKFPSQNKLPVDLLEQRLTKALDSAQQLSKMTKTIPLDPSTLKIWSSSMKPLVDATRRLNMTEAVQSYMAKSSGLTVEAPLFKNSFTDLRMTIESLGDQWDKGYKAFYIADSEKDVGFLLRVVNVYSLGEEEPIFVVLYSQGKAASGDDVVMGFSVHYTGVDGNIVHCKATEEEQDMLLRLLKMNSKRLVPEYDAPRIPVEEDFVISFCCRLDHCPREISEPSPVTQVAQSVGPRRRRNAPDATPSVIVLGNVNVKTGRTTNQCHRESLTQPSIVTTRFHSLKDKNNIKEGTLEPPPNLRGENVFLVKIQISGFGLLIYDRKKKLEVHVLRNGDPKGYAAVAKVSSGKPKIYRWAKRVGDRQLSVCLDVAPQEDVPW
ncbi:hypothetical protein BD410DRAFT_525568 [Rickenella mellea]|uniref:Uncharacterized protein n=1 Tax=Rickenella mellea TaxID=50990 RepID=A0A4Y7QH33_9AGAM|nr:hypothetical protein BD410DRAFT_525568 [Rickenella mellea]